MVSWSSASSVGACARQGHPAGLEHVGAVRRPERHARVLLHEEDGRPGVAEHGQEPHDLAHHERGEPERRLVARGESAGGS